MEWQTLLEWWNLVFVLPFTLAVVLILLSCTGVLHSDHDMDADADADGDVDHDVSMEHDVGDGDHDAEHDTDHDAEDGGWWKALSFLGVGKVPLSIIITTFLLIWGFVGWASNMFFNQFLPPWMFVWISMGMALIGSVSVTKTFSGVMQRIMPTTETYGCSNADLVGKTAETLFSITEKFGRARVKDNKGHILDLDCRVRPGKETIGKGAKVVLMEYNQEQKYFFVRQDPLNQ